MGKTSLSPGIIKSNKIPRSSSQDVLRRLDLAFKKFFKQKKGYPKYKKKGQWDSVKYTQYREGPVDGKITVPKIGEIKIVYHRLIPDDAEIKTLTIKKKGGKWFACFSLEIPNPVPVRVEPKTEHIKTTGIDLGLDSFVYDDLGNSETAPRFLREEHLKIKKLQKKLSKTKKRTKKYFKILKALQRTYYRLQCKRLAFFYELSYKLFANVDIIFYENLDIANMVKRPEPIFDEATSSYLPNGASRKAGLNRAIYDAGWGKFIEILKQVAAKLGKLAIGVDPRYTSQICSNCGVIVEKSLSTRTHNCHNCGYVENRDCNAAKNILRFGLESLSVGALEAPAKNA